MTTALRSQEIEIDNSCSPVNRTLYICRRIQSLKDTDKKPEKWKNYLKMRSMLLKQRYNNSIVSSGENQGLSKLFKKMNISNDHKNTERLKSSSIMSTREALASKAIVGGNSIIENYSFVGVHHIFDQHKQCVTMVKFANNDASKLCCSSTDTTLSICDVLTNPPSIIAVLKGHTGGVTSFDWSENNDLIASTSLDSTVKIWSIQKFSCLATIQDERDLKLFCCLFQPANNNIVVVGNNAGEIRSVNISTGRYIKEWCKLNGCILSIAFDNTGRLLWTGNDKGEIFCLKCELDGRMYKNKRLTIPVACSISSLSFRIWMSREARDPTLLVSSTNNTISLYSITDSEGGLILKRKYYNHHNYNAIKSTFCPMMSFREGSCIVSGSEDGDVHFLDIEKCTQKAQINTLKGHSKPVIGVSFNYDESLLATSDLDGLVIIWKRADLSETGKVEI